MTGVYIEAAMQEDVARLYRAYLAAKLTHTQLCALLGTSNMTPINWYKGRVPREGVLRRIHELTLRLEKAVQKKLLPLPPARQDDLDMLLDVLQRKLPR